MRIVDPALIRVSIVSGDKQTINNIRRLLYRECIEVQNWNFSPSNPSGLRIEKSNEGDFLLVDDRDMYAKWFVAYYGNQVIGCARICDRNSVGVFEIQAYDTGVDFGGLLSKDRYPNLIEMSRGAVEPAFRNSGVSILILFAIFKYCKENQLSACTAPSWKKIINLYLKIQFPHPQNIWFKWELQDPLEALFFLVDYQSGHIQKIIDNLEIMIHRLEACYNRNQDRLIR